MTNKKLWLGMLVLILTFGMTVVGCDNDANNSGSENNGNNINGQDGSNKDDDDKSGGPKYPTAASLVGTFWAASNGNTLYSLKFTSDGSVDEAYLIDGYWAAWFSLGLPKAYSYSYYYGRGYISASGTSYDFTVSTDGTTLSWERPNTGVAKLTYNKQSINSSTGSIKINNTSGNRIDTIYIVNSTNLDVHYKNNGGMTVGSNGTTFSSVPVGTYYVYVAAGNGQGAKTGVSVSSGQTTTLTFNGSSVL